jgi:tetratricopeptide (TPR) repeat protein
MMTMLRRITVALVLGCLLAAPALAQAHSAELEAGMKAFYAGDMEGALVQFEECLKRRPQDSLAMAYLLDVAYKQKEVNEVINRVEQRAVARGEDPTALAHLGLAYFLRGMLEPDYLDEAITELKQAVNDDPQLSIGYTGLGMIYYQKRMMPRAKGYFVRSLRVNRHDIMAMELLGNIYLVDEKKPEDARQLFSAIVAELPTYPDGHYYMGSALFDLGRLDEAIPYLQRCKELDPKGMTMGFEAASLLGDVLMKENRVPEAIEAYQHALAMRPDSQYIEVRLRQAKGEKV